MSRTSLVLSVVIALLVVSGLSLALIISEACLEGDTTLDFLALVVGPVAVAVLAYTLFVVAGPRRLRRTKWRYALGVPFALLAAAALFVAVLGLAPADCTS